MDVAQSSRVVWPPADGVQDAAVVFPPPAPISSSEPCLTHSITQDRDILQGTTCLFRDTLIANGVCVGIADTGEFLGL